MTVSKVVPQCHTVYMIMRWNQEYSQKLLKGDYVS